MSAFPSITFKVVAVFKALLPQKTIFFSFREIFGAQLFRMYDPLREMFDSAANRCILLEKKSPDKREGKRLPIFSEQLSPNCEKRGENFITI